VFAVLLRGVNSVMEKDALLVTILDGLRRIIVVRNAEGR